MDGQVTYEEVLKWAGDLGVYQLAIFAYFAGINLSGVEAIYMNFIGYKMDHWCKVPELAAFPFEMQKHIAIPYSSNSSDGRPTYENCQMFDLNYSSYNLEHFVNWPRPPDTEIIDCNEWVFDQSVYSENMVNEWQTVCNKNWQVDLVSTMNLAGYFFGALAGGALSDRFGRRKAVGIGIVMRLVANMASTLAPNYVTFIIARFFVGFASHYAYIVGFVLVIENIGDIHRPWIGIAFSIFFSLGFALVPVFALACQNWRNLQLIMTVPGIIHALTAWFLPESPRWLLSKGKLKEAEDGICLIAAVNNCNLPDDFEITKVKIENKNNNNQENKATIVDVFKSPKLRRYTLIQFVIWFSTSIIYQALSLNAGALSGNLYLNTSLLGLVEIPACILSFIGMGFKPLGRKRTLALASLTGGVACMICVPILVTDEDSLAVTALSLVGKAGAAAAFNGLFIFTSEIYPTEVRNVGLGACSMAARVSGLSAPYIGGLLGDIWRPMPSLIFGVVGSISGLLTLLLPETYGKKLPETIEEFEHGTAKPEKSHHGTAEDKADHGHNKQDTRNDNEKNQTYEEFKSSKLGTDRLQAHDNYACSERL